MSVYEKLVSLASKPCFENVILTNDKGDRLFSHDDIIHELKSEFVSNDLSSSICIDMRQACETRVSDH